MTDATLAPVWMTLVEVDAENNADAWWADLTATYPQFAALLRRDGKALVGDQALRDLQALDGYADGPAHAREALRQIERMDLRHFDRAAIEADGLAIVDELS